MYNKMERTAVKKSPLSYIQGQVVPCHCCHSYGTWGSREVEGSFKIIKRGRAIHRGWSCFS